MQCVKLWAGLRFCVYRLFICWLRVLVFAHIFTVMRVFCCPLRHSFCAIQFLFIISLYSIYNHKCWAYMRKRGDAMYFFFFKWWHFRKPKIVCAVWKVRTAAIKRACVLILVTYICPDRCPWWSPPPLPPRDERDLHAGGCRSITLTWAGGGVHFQLCWTNELWWLTWLVHINLQWARFFFIFFHTHKNGDATWLFLSFYTTNKSFLD